MGRYIGLDAHASSCTLGVMTPSGKRIGSHVVETSRSRPDRWPSSCTRSWTRWTR